MQINDDLSKPVIVHAARLDWVPSPSAGVDRRMLYREGGEVARATSIVRYARGSAFPSHTHNGGEEILVLDGHCAKSVTESVKSLSLVELALVNLEQGELSVEGKADEQEILQAVAQAGYGRR